MIMTDTSTERSHRSTSPRMPDASAYHSERRRYLARARRNPGLRQRYLRNLAGYLLPVSYTHLTLPTILRV